MPKIVHIVIEQMNAQLEKDRMSSMGLVDIRKGNYLNNFIRFVESLLRFCMELRMKIYKDR